MRFEGQVVIVTGGASGIGEAAARRFASEGAQVVVADIRPEPMQRVVDDLEGTGHLGLEIDTINPAAIDQMVEQVVARCGRLNILVNNAGMGSFGRATDIDLAHWRTLMQVDLDAVFWASRQAIPHLTRSKGCIVNVASIAGVAGDHSFAAYSAAKAAVINLTRSMALDHGPEVRVNAVSPGLTATPLATGLTGNPEVMAAYQAVIPLARAAIPDEIASAIAFLASPDAAYVTGHNLVVDGGLTASTGQPNFTKLLGGKSHLAGAETAIAR